MMNHEKNEVTCIQAIDQIFSQIKSKSPSIDLAELKIEKERLMIIMNDKYGAELFARKWLNLKELLQVESIRGVQYYIEKIINIVNYYSHNREKINWNIENILPIAERFTTGRLDNWEALAAHDINLMNLSNHASTVFIIYVLGTMSSRFVNINESARANLIEKKRQLDEENKKKEEENNQHLQEALLIPIIQTQLVEAQSIEEEKKAIKQMQEDLQERKEKAEELVLIEEENFNKETATRNKIRDSEEKDDVCADKSQDIEKNNEILRNSLEEKKRLEYEKSQEIQRAFQEKIFAMSKIIYFALGNYSLWAKQVSQNGDSPELNWVKDSHGKNIKVPTGIFKQINIAKTNPINFSCSYNPEIFPQLKKILEALAGIAGERLEHKGIFSTRRSKTKDFYRCLHSIDAALKEEDLYEAVKKLNAIDKDLMPYMQSEEEKNKELDDKLMSLHL